MLEVNMKRMIEDNIIIGFKIRKVNETYPMSSLFFSEASGKAIFSDIPEIMLNRSPRYFDLQPMQLTQGTGTRDI